MTKLLACLLLAAAPLTAQVPTPKTEVSPLLGTWEGPYQSDHGSGGLRLVVSRDSVWRATLASAPESMIPEAYVENLKVEDGRLSWTQSVMGASCSASAALEAGALRGEMTCEHGGATIQIRFLLVKP